VACHRRDNREIPPLRHDHRAAAESGVAVIADSWSTGVCASPRRGDRALSWCTAVNVGREAYHAVLLAELQGR